MISLRRTHDRHHGRSGKHDAWATFYRQTPGEALAGGFGTLFALTEDHLPPGTVLRRCASNASGVVTYVREGVLAYEDALGNSGVICAGEFQCRADGHRARMSQSNASRTDCAHVFQLGFGPSMSTHGAFLEQKRFGVGDRRYGLCLVASPDGRHGSVRLWENARVYSALLDPGQHRVHELLPRRGAWLHVVLGEVSLADLVLNTGDGAGVTGERAVSLTARRTSEILLLDVGLSPRGRKSAPSN